MLNPHQNTEIGEGGARELALALELNTAITSVDLNVRGGEGRGEVHAAWRQDGGESLLTPYAESHAGGWRSKRGGTSVEAQHLHHLVGYWSTWMRVWIDSLVTRGINAHSCIQENNIREGGAREVARALELNTSITLLNLGVRVEGRMSGKGGESPLTCS